MKEECERLGELLDAYLERLRQGDAPAQEAYADANPEFREELLAALPLLVDVEHVGISHDTPQRAYYPPPDFSGSDFRILRRIGGGGMGIVYEAHQISLDRKVAVKVLSPACPMEDVALHRLENEARVIAQLYHPNIVKVFTAGRQDGTFFYAMELLPGSDLACQPPSGPREIARIGRDAARALAYAHGCGVMHCDVKPSNLFLDADGILKIGDFGLALQAEGCGTSLSTRDGTPRYMAPERLLQKQMDFSSDQYSLGATLYEFIAGRPLRSDIRHAHLKFPDGTDRDLAAIIRKSLARDPSERYASMSDLADDLARYLDRRPVLAAPPSPARRFLLWFRRDPFRASACLLAILCGIGFVLTLAFGIVHSRQAAELARVNAQKANNALTTVFKHIANQPPDPNGSKLLDALLPYFEDLSDEAQLSHDDRTTAYRLLVRYAIHAGKHELAEKLLHRLIELDAHDITYRTRLAFVIQQQGRKEEADAIWNEISTRFSEEGTPDERAAAARALANVGAVPIAANRKRALGILRGVLSEHPDNKAARFQYACLLMDSDLSAENELVPGLPSDPVVLLDELVRQSPDTLRFALFRLKAMYEHIEQKAFDGSPVDEKVMARAVEWAEDLYARFANHPGVASLVYRVRKEHVDHLRRHAPPPVASRLAGRLNEYTLSVFGSDDIPEHDKESILDIQIDELADMSENSRRFFGRHAQLIRSELERFTGTRKDEFEERYERIRSKVPEQDEAERRHRHRHRHRRRWPGDDL